jgi:hypothetical protein
MARKTTIGAPLTSLFWKQTTGILKTQSCIRGRYWIIKLHKDAYLAANTYSFHGKPAREVDAAFHEDSPSS